jgi:acyl-CoA reductase-like NAD-dependent aldehyde dehydrogenase
MNRMNFAYWNPVKIRFCGIKDSGSAKEGVVEAMKSFTNVKTRSLPWNA